MQNVEPRQREWGFNTVIEILVDSGYVIAGYYCGDVIHSDCLKFPMFCPKCGSSFKNAMIYPRQKKFNADTQMKFYDYPDGIQEEQI